MVTTTTTHNRRVGTQQGIMQGVLGGLAGGVVFGTMMQALGMIGMIGMLVGSESLAVAWVLHLVISAVFGAVFGAVVAPRVYGWGAGLGAGLAYGLVLWVVGPLLMMPAMMGMPVFTIDAMALQSLVGHLLFGVVLGAVVVALSGRARA
jgi:uncharacterized membrane protein YagU involved in acid resistance